MLDTTSRPAQSEGPPADDHPYRMKDLCEQTGLPRQVIHFYIQQGLLPPGHKTGRNMAYYGQAHVDRIKLIRQLQHERFLPLKAIKALLDGRDEEFTSSQRLLLVGLHDRLAENAEELLARAGVAREDLERAIELGYVAARKENGRLQIAADQAWLIETWGELRRAGFTKELGFTVDDLGEYEEAIGALFTREAQMLAGRVAHLPPERVATMIEKALPLIHAFITRYHEMRVKQFFASMG
jgi:DNA-binding transcriptional MerR regulator